MSRIQFVLPPESLRRAFAERVKPLFAKIRANSEQSRVLGAMRDSLLPTLFSGGSTFTWNHEKTDRLFAMLTGEQIKAELSYAYLHAVASRAGFECGHGPRNDMDSVDALVQARGQLTADSTLFSPRLEFQLKATVISPLAGADLSYIP